MSLQRIRTVGLTERNFLQLSVCLILAVLVFVFYRFLSGHSLYLFKDIGSDSINGAYPQLAQLSRYLASEGLPGWSFYQGLGQNIYPFWCSDPFSLPLLLLSPEYIPYGLVWREAFKIVLAGVLFFLYLRVVRISPLPSLIGAVLYAFCGYVVLGSCWTYMSQEAVYAAFLLWAFEKYFMEKRIAFLPLAVCLFCMASTYGSIQYGGFLFLYALVRIAETWPDRHLHPTFKSYGWVLAAGALGIVLSFHMLVPNSLQVLYSPRGSTAASYQNTLLALPVWKLTDHWHNVTAILRLFSNDILGSGSLFTGWVNYLEAPAFYCGLLVLPLLPQSFFGISSRSRWAYGALIMICVLPVAFPYFRYAFWFFAGDYYRTYAFMVVLFFLYIGLRSLDHVFRRGRLHVPALVATTALSLLILYFPYRHEHLRIDREIRDLAALFVSIYTVLLLMMHFRHPNRIAKLMLVAMICIEAALFGWVTVNRRSTVMTEEWHSKAGYNDYTVGALAHLRSTDHSFFRIHKDFSSSPAVHVGLNDAMVQGYYGTSSYSSFNQLHYIHFLAGMDVIDRQKEVLTRWVSGLGSRPLLLTLTSVKYWLTKKPDESPPFAGYRPLGKFGDVSVYRNDLFLPMGFCYDTVIPARSLDRMTPFQKDVAMLSAVVVPDSHMPDYGGFAVRTFSAQQTYLDLTGYESLVKGLNEYTLQIEHRSQNRIRGRLTLEKRKVLFFSIPYDPGWGARVNGRPAELKLVNIGFMGLPLEKGSHTIELVYRPPWALGAAAISLGAFVLYWCLVLWETKALRGVRKPKSTANSCLVP